MRLSALFALALIALSACATAPGPAPDGQTRPPFPTTENRAAFGLAHVDVETTGLDPDYHEMIDAGLIYTDLDGRELGRIYVRILPTHPERISEGARAVNGFDVAYWTSHGAVSEAEAVRQILDFHRRVSGGRTMIFTAYNAQFDTRFMTALLAEHGAAFGRRRVERPCYTCFHRRLERTDPTAHGHGHDHGGMLAPPRRPAAPGCSCCLRMTRTRAGASTTARCCERMME
jgi:oligoribonuclease (3'-5' exoribonuclease)